MAGASVLPPAEVLLSKRVQEMALNGEQPPAPYVSRYDYDATEDDFSTVSEIPIIDLGILSSSEASTEEYEEELMKLKSALQSWGCFQVWTRTLHLLYIFCCSSDISTTQYLISRRSEICRFCQLFTLFFL